MFVAHAGPDVVGWIHVQATCLLECDARAEIWGLVFAETARGTGVGRRLVEAAEAWALLRGLAVITLRSNRLRAGARHHEDTKTRRHENTKTRRGNC